VSCEFLRFDTSNGEARLSLRAPQSDPVRPFLMDEAIVGQVLRGTVTKLVPFGAFVWVAAGVERLAHLQEMTSPTDALRVGDEIMVAVAGIVRDRRQLALSQRAALAD
jgi:ribosomal protein S1